MRDLVVREALRTMATDAAERLRELVASGEQIPYDVEESGSGSPLPRYVPLTERFIGEHAAVLRDLDSFGSGCAAIESAGLAGPYLEAMGVAVPTDQGRRGELAAVAFLCRLWEESTDFSLEDDRLRAAVAELEAGGDAADDEIDVVVPLRGLQLPVTRLELATATIVRADTVEVPAEARAPEGSGAAGWEPVFLAATRVSDRVASEDEAEPKPDAGARAVAAFRQLITTLRLFKAGTVSLGPYAWTRVGANRWRRIATGCGRTRPGGYRLAEEELGDLVACSRTLAYRSQPIGGSVGFGPGVPRGLARAVSRFEAGLERGVAFEALNDYLLALRFLLEGGGPAALSLSVRVAALCAEPERRAQTKAIVDRGLALERELWSGDPPIGNDDAPTVVEAAPAVEGLTRAILADAACGHLGSDLRSTADEILLADGLAEGEGKAEQRGGPEEWAVGLDSEPGSEEGEAELEPASDLPTELTKTPLTDLERELNALAEGSGEPSAAQPGRPEPEPWIDAPAEWEDAPPARDRGGSMQVPEPDERIRVESHPRPEEKTLFTNAYTDADLPTTTMESLPPSQGRLAELLEHRPTERQRTSDRVASLFPRPETTEWDVRELSYDRRRRARVRAT